MGEENSIGFYQSFEELLNIQQITDQELTKSDFRKFIINQNGKTPEVVKMISFGLIPTIQKPQQLIYNDPDYYIAIDTYTYTYYVCYRNLMMIDIDFYKEDTNSQLSEPEIMEQVRKYCQEFHPEFLFRVFRSRNGLHLFLLNQPMNYKDLSAIKIMLDLGSDFYYTVFAYLRGWSVRLNRKDNDNSTDIYQYITDIGSGKINPQLEKLVNLHLNLMHVFQNDAPNLMYSG